MWRKRENVLGRIFHQMKVLEVVVLFSFTNSISNLIGDNIVYLPALWAWFNPYRWPFTHCYIIVNFHIKEI